MDVYDGISAQADNNNYFPIDDLLDFSNDELFSAASSSTDSVSDHHQMAPLQNPSSAAFINPTTTGAAAITNFTDDLCVPSADVAELEWLSQFVDDSFSDFPGNSLTVNALGGATLTVRSDTSAFTSKSRTKRSKAATANNNWITTSSSPLEPITPVAVKSRQKHSHDSPPSEGEAGVRRCTHCASEKTPQWRTGPLGPKTLCNACGVRYKSGRLVPEYRPASSPTFVLSQHSNSHRKVMELRRQKEMKEQQRSPEEMQMHMYRRRRHQRDFEVC
ncbi:GATA transcription factor 4 [Rutidosis leptorrhynchoides]|uniref:GATA transcription factor 4 n=1 Tax=Rutidosis leptorrhynchoides TaxID=125765 RepID=UPI003A99383F